MTFNYETRNTAQRKRDKPLGREREGEREGLSWSESE